LSADDEGNYAFKVADGIYDLVINEGALSETRIDRLQIAEIVGFNTDNAHYSDLTTAAAANLTVSTIITTAGYYSTNDGGGAQYVVVAAGTGPVDGGLYINMLNSNQLELIVQTPLDIRQFGAVDAGTASTPFSSDAIQAALNTGLNVFIPDGTFLIDKELLINTAGQSLTGETLGSRLGKKVVDNVQSTLKTPIGTTIARYTKTRRNARTSGADPVDSPISCMINIEAVGVTIANLYGELECDYSDFSQFNLGADCDVFIFNGCRGGQTFEDLTWLGYFRVAGLLLDSTRGTNLPEFETPGGVTYSDTGTNGGDQIQIKRCQGSGGLKQIFLRGPVLNGADTYFDESTGLVGDTRGGSGNSDLKIADNCVFEGRDHHSGYRAYDFVGDPDSDNIELISCPILIDAVRGSSSQGRTRRIAIYDTRLRTIESARLFTGRAYELFLSWFHTEPLGGFSGVVYDTSGVVIDPSNTTTQTYGPLACQTTSGVDTGTDQVRCEGVWGTGLVTAWCRTPVTNFSDSRVAINPQFSVTFDSDVNVGDDITAGDRITATGILGGSELELTTSDTAFTPQLLLVAAPTYTVQTGKYTKISNIVFIDLTLTYSGLDTADTSPMGISALPFIKDSGSSFSVQINSADSDGLVNPQTMYFDDNGSSTQIGLYDATGSLVTYNSGRINAAGTIKLTVTYRV
jgi:hypothetical protein